MLRRPDEYFCTACQTWARFGEYHGLDVCERNRKAASAKKGGPKA